MDRTTDWSTYVLFWANTYIAKNRKTAYHYKPKVEWQPQAVFVEDSQTEEVLLHDIGNGYTTTAMNDIR